MIERFLGFHPQISPKAFVHAAATVIGDVEIGEGSSIWPHATLRGDDGPLRIGCWTSIQDGSVLHNMEGLSTTKVGDRCTIGHNVILHGCTIEDDCLIGMGAIILDNARIERGSIVAAGALVPSGKVVAAGTLALGNPAQMFRVCNEKDRAMIDHGWREYAKRVEQYLAMANGTL